MNTNTNHWPYLQRDSVRQNPTNAFHPYNLGTGESPGATSHAAPFMAQQNPLIALFPLQYSTHFSSNAFPMRNILFGSNVTAAVAPSNGQNATESFHVTLTPAQRATLLQRAKNMRLAPKTCDQLTQQIVQDVISRFADGTKTHAQRILRGETTTAEQNKTATTSTPGAVASSDPVAPVNLDAAEAATNGAAAAAASSDPVDVVLVNSDVAEAASNGAATAAASSDAVDAAEPATNGSAAAVAPVPAAPLKAWNLLKPRERSRRCFQAARLFKPFWALFVAALGAVDDDGLPLSNNALFAIFLQIRRGPRPRRPTQIRRRQIRPSVDGRNAEGPSIGGAVQYRHKRGPESTRGYRACCRQTFSKRDAGPLRRDRPARKRHSSSLD